MAINAYLSIITLNVNGLNAPIKRHRVADWIKKETFNLPSTRNSPQGKGHIQIEREGVGKDISCNGQDRKAGVAILISDKIDFKTKAIEKDKEGHYLMVKDPFKKRILQLPIYIPLTEEHPDTYNKY